MLGTSVAGVLALPAAAETASGSAATSTTAKPTAAKPAVAKPAAAKPAAQAAAQPAAKTVAKSGTAKPAANPYCKRYKCIALTFDDGPWPYTPALLDTLKKHKAKATFFVLGRKVANRMELTKRIQDEGHEIGNHTWDHPNLTELDNDEILVEVSSTQDIIYEATGRYPTMMRPPSGAVDKRVRALMAELGLPVVKWHVQTLDFQARNVKVIKNRVLKGAKRNAIVLLHDIVPETVKAMPDVLTKLKKQGYRFVTVSRLLEGKPLKAGQLYPAPR